MQSLIIPLYFNVKYCTVPTVCFGIFFFLLQLSKFLPVEVVKASKQKVLNKRREYGLCIHII